MNHDQTLWQSLRAGEKAALASIYQNEVDALFRYGCQFTRDEGLVEDAIQDLFIELWKNHEGLGATDAIRQYLLVALRRKIVRQLQQQNNREQKAAVNYQSSEISAAPDQVFIQSEEEKLQQKTMNTALQQLSERQREILYLKYFEGLNYKQIAEMLDINHQSVRNTASAGLKALRKLVIPMIIFLFYFLLNFSN